MTLNRMLMRHSRGKPKEKGGPLKIRLDCHLFENKEIENPERGEKIKKEVLAFAPY